MAKTADNTQKNPQDWKSGDEPATGAQQSYISTMASEANQPTPTNLSKAEASKVIDKLRRQTGRDGPEGGS